MIYKLTKLIHVAMVGLILTACKSNSIDVPSLYNDDTSRDEPVVEIEEKGYDVDDPTTETLDQWKVDFRVEFDWDDPKAKTANEECSDEE